MTNVFDRAQDVIERGQDFSPDLCEMLAKRLVGEGVLEAVEDGRPSLYQQFADAGATMDSVTGVWFDEENGTYTVGVTAWVTEHTTNAIRSVLPDAFVIESFAPDEESAFRMVALEGGKGSGNWGHDGVVGHLGGSAPNKNKKRFYVQDEITNLQAYLDMLGGENVDPAALQALIDKASPFMQTQLKALGEALLASEDPAGALLAAKGYIAQLLAPDFENKPEMDPANDVLNDAPEDVRAALGTVGADLVRMGKIKPEPKGGGKGGGGKGGGAAKKDASGSGGKKATVGDAPTPDTITDPNVVGNPKTYAFDVKNKDGEIVAKVRGGKLLWASNDIAHDMSVFMTHGVQPDGQRIPTMIDAPDYIDALNSVLSDMGLSMDKKKADARSDEADGGYWEDEYPGVEL